MTTIAYDGRYLAADTMATYGQTIKCQQPYSKLRMEARKGYGNAVVHYAFALAGNLATLQAWSTWFHGIDTQLPVDPHKAPVGAGAETTFIVVVQGMPAHALNAETPYMLEADVPDAWGSGARFALGAMAMGANAVEAVAAAMVHDAYTGGMVEFIELHPDKPWEVQTFDPHEFLGDVPSIRRYHHTLALPPATPTPVPSSPRATPVLVVPTPPPAPTQVAITIPKPRKFAPDAAGEGGFWMDDCAGRLIDGNGCGRCLRCVREWHAILKLGMNVVNDVIPLSAIERNRVREAWNGKAAVQPVEVAPDTDSGRMRALEVWIDSYNDAYDDATRSTLEFKLRTMVFPPRVELNQIQTPTGPKYMLRKIEGEAKA